MGRLGREPGVAWESLHALLRHLMHAVAGSLPGAGAELEEEAVQEAALRLVANPEILRKADPGAPLAAFLRTFARNVVREILRREKRRRSISLDAVGAATAPASDPPPVVRFAQRETIERAVSAIRSLPTPYRQILHLLYVRRWDEAEVTSWTAAWLGVSRSRAKEMRKEARRAHRAVLAGRSPPRLRRKCPPPPPPCGHMM